MAAPLSPAFRRKHCGRNRLALPETLWRFFLKGSVCSRTGSFQRDGPELYLGEVPGVTPGTPLRSRVECELLRLHENWMCGIDYFLRRADRPAVGAVRTDVLPAAAIFSKAASHPLHSDGGNGKRRRVQYGDAWCGGMLDYGAAGGNDTSYSQQQLQAQGFAPATPAGKANLSLWWAGVRASPVRVILGVEGDADGRMFYHGLYKVRRAYHTWVEPPGSQLPQPQCVHPACQRAREREGRLNCAVPDHRCPRPVCTIRFELVAWTS
jgi:hypothetical protein